MARITWADCLLPALCVAFLTGCVFTSKKPPYPEDPLLLSRKPPEGKPESFRPQLLARAEPEALPLPASLLASRTKAKSSGSAALKTAPQDSAARADAASPPLPRTRLPVRAIPTARRRVAGIYGHAADLSWLQGVLVKSPGGSLHLRYLAASEDAAQPAQVALEHDPRLAAFRPGDVILVEGEKLTQSGDTAESTGSPVRYRVHAVWLVKRGAQE